MIFDGSSSREGLGAKVVLISPTNHVTSLSCKLEFETNNNTTEYEALILGLKATKYLKVEHIEVFGDSELIIQHVKDIYQTKQPKLKMYMHKVWDIIHSYFTTFYIYYISREANQLAHSMAIVASSFKVPQDTKFGYEIKLKCRPLVLDNIKHCQVFEDEQEVKRFMECVEEFSIAQIDLEEDIVESTGSCQF